MGIAARGAICRAAKGSLTMRRFAVTSAARLIAVAALATALRPEVLTALESPSQQKCSQALNKSAALVSKGQGRQVADCIKLGTRGALGNPPDVAACLTSSSGRMDKIGTKIIGKELQSCVPPGGLPSFGVPELAGSYFPPLDVAGYNPNTHRIYSAPIRAASSDAEISVAREIFGSDIDSAVQVNNGHLSSCQATIMKLVQKCEAAKRKLFGNCKKQGLKAGTIANAAALSSACFAAGSNLNGSASDQAKLNAICLGKMTDALGKKCTGVSLASAFPGSCLSAAGTLGAFVPCVERRVNCRLCQQINGTDDLDKDCDLFDDGIANASCAALQGVCGDGVVDPTFEQCDDGNTDDGDCCSSACHYESAGSACGDDNDDQCANPDTCDGAGVCLSNDALSGVACDDDGNACTDDQCDGEGACIHPNRSAGTACGDASESDCNHADSCNGSGTCVSNLAAAGTTCTADGNVCTTDECNGSGACAHTNNSASCDDGSYCNGVDTCSGGTCALHAGDPCVGADGDANCAESCDEDADACTGADPNGSACSDGQFCNGTETCSAGVCSGSSGNPCPGADGDANCAESCDETADTCTANDTDGASCSDNVFCNGTDTCSAGVCGTHSGNPCSSGGDCADVCNELAGNCFEAAGTACNSDSNPCTDDVCSGAGSCLHPNKSSGTACPDDGLECTFDQCDGGGTCGHPNKNAGTSCTSDGNGCTDDVCNGSGACAHNNNTAACNDNQYCNGADTCSGGSCSVHAGSPCAGPDGDVNCKESCNESTDTCNANDPDGSACSDGAACNGTGDTCQGGTCVATGVCCGTQDFTFTVNSNNGGAFDSAEWPGGTQSQTSAPGCSVTIQNPNNNIDTVCTTANPFAVQSFAGFSNCFGSGGEDGDGCEPQSCPPAGIGQCCSGRPSCSSAVNGSGSARYRVHCVDP